MMLFFLGGARTRFRTIDKGRFFCPQEQSEQQYIRKRGTLWLEVYFIPLMPIGEKDDVIECQSCGHHYDPAVLTKRQPIAARKAHEIDAVGLINDMQKYLNNGMPIEYLIRDLTAARLDRAITMKLVHDQIGNQQANCPNCGLSYAPSVACCIECGADLQIV